MPVALMPQTATSSGQIAAHPGIPIVVPRGAVKPATSAGTPIRRVSRSVVTGRVPTLLWVVNAVAWAGANLRNHANGLTSAPTRNRTPLTTKVSTAHTAYVMASRLASDQMRERSSAAFDTAVAVSASTAYGVNQMT